MDAAAWDERYAAHRWSGRPVPTPSSSATWPTSRPGAALDLACGEGRNARWLAARGWQVTALDWSAVGVDEGAGGSTRPRSTGRSATPSPLRCPRTSTSSWSPTSRCRPTTAEARAPRRRGARPRRHAPRRRARLHQPDRGHGRPPGPGRALHRRGRARRPRRPRRRGAPRRAGRPRRSRARTGTAPRAPPRTPWCTCAAATQLDGPEELPQRRDPAQHEAVEQQHETRLIPKSGRNTPSATSPTARHRRVRTGSRPRGAPAAAAGRPASPPHQRPGHAHARSPPTQNARTAPCPAGPGCGPRAARCPARRPGRAAGSRRTRTPSAPPRRTGRRAPSARRSGRRRRSRSPRTCRARLAGSATVIGCRNPSPSATATAVSTLATATRVVGAPAGTSLLSIAHGSSAWLCGSDSSSVEVGADCAPWSSLHSEDPDVVASRCTCSPHTPVHGRPVTTITPGRRRRRCPAPRAVTAAARPVGRGPGCAGGRAGRARTGSSRSAPSPSPSRCPAPSPGRRRSRPSGRRAAGSRAAQRRVGVEVPEHLGATTGRRRRPAPSPSASVTEKTVLRSSSAARSSRRRSRRGSARSTARCCAAYGWRTSEPAGCSTFITSACSSGSTWKRKR